VSTPLIARVVDEPLSVADHEEAVADKRAGAVVSFCGVVRDHDDGRSVTELEYVGHPTATGSGCWASATSPWPARSARPIAARRSRPAPSSSTR
jgi:hypothetical protein